MSRALLVPVGSGEPVVEAAVVKPDFLSDLKSEMEKVLPTRSHREKAAFSKLPLSEQTWRFLNWQNRLIHPHPRRIFLADGFSLSDLTSETRRDVERLFSQIEQGENVCQHLSKQVARDGYCLHDRGKNGTDFDHLLNDWGLHHLHLKRAREPDDGQVLFVRFEPETAYIVAVGPHRAWAELHLAERLIRSWPEARFFIPLNVLPGHPWTPSELIALRKAGHCSHVVVDGRVWIPGKTLGMTTALVSTATSREASRILWHAAEMSDTPDVIEAMLKNAAALLGREWPTHPQIRLRRVIGLFAYGFAFTEEHTMICRMI